MKLVECGTVDSICSVLDISFHPWLRTPENCLWVNTRECPTQRKYTLNPTVPFFFCGRFMSYVSYVSGQIIATSHDLTPNGGLVREIPLFQENLGWWNIIIWPDVWRKLFCFHVWLSSPPTKHVLSWGKGTPKSIGARLCGGRGICWVNFRSPKRWWNRRKSVAIGQEEFNWRITVVGNAGVLFKGLVKPLFF